MLFVKYLTAVSPVFLFLAALVVFDSFKLIPFRNILGTIVIGCAAAVLAYFINNAVADFAPGRSAFFWYAAPMIEESLKASFIIYLIVARRIGFMVDAAIYGFALGAGFGIFENTYYLYMAPAPELFVWIIRGFGTAVMHGITAATFAIVSKNFDDRSEKLKPISFVPGLAAAFAIHSFYNHFLFSPPVWTLVQLAGFVLVMIVLYHQSELAMREWLGIGLDSEIELLRVISAGQISDTRVGKYLQSIKKKFPGDVVVDMLCLVQVHLELSVKAKGMLLIHEAGLTQNLDAETKEKFNELHFLENSIGMIGNRALAPILHLNSRDLWELHFLEHK
ncbi:MAG TPA: PrsW family glutamic-type intramembrane protease [Bacteroidota bacterium]|nr:PrsW family glutamic-type intramembrane protease [Bacteroidota bacterium]